ncbi:MAG: hypothetical protein HY074_16525 [Deltaproteobacteria bacterium]|nr:hypothetical protein [Deltaproteobacteria bacterium]
MTLKTTTEPDTTKSEDKSSLLSTAPAPKRRVRQHRLGPLITETADRQQREETRHIVHERCGINLYALGEDGGPCTGIIGTGVVLDICKNGIGIITNAGIPPGTHVILELLSSKFNHQFQATVLWHNPLPSENKIIKETPGTSLRMGLLFEIRSREEVAVLAEIAQLL